MFESACCAADLDLAGVRLVVLDLDDTLMTAADFAGSPAWWTEANRQLGRELALAVWQTMLRAGRIRMAPACPHVVDWVAGLRLPLVYLTARHATLEDITRQQLRQLGLPEAPLLFTNGSRKLPWLAELRSEATGTVLFLDDQPGNLASLPGLRAVHARPARCRIRSLYQSDPGLADAAPGGRPGARGEAGPADNLLQDPDERPAGDRRAGDQSDLLGRL